MGWGILLAEREMSYKLNIYKDLTKLRLGFVQEWVTEGLDIDLNCLSQILPGILAFIFYVENN